MQQPAMPPPFSPAAGTVSAAGQHATPISSRPPPEPQQQQQHQVDELGGGSASAGSSFVVDHDDASVGDDGGRRKGIHITNTSKPRNPTGLRVLLACGHVWSSRP